MPLMALAALIILAAVAMLTLLLRSSGPPPYRRAALFSPHEAAFYRELRRYADARGLTLLAKVRMADLLAVEKGATNYQAWFNRISQKRILCFAAPVGSQRSPLWSWTTAPTTGPTANGGTNSWMRRTPPPESRLFISAASAERSLPSCLTAPYVNNADSRTHSHASQLTGQNSSSLSRAASKSAKASGLLLGLRSNAAG